MTRRRSIVVLAALLLAACSGSNDEICNDGKDNDSNGLTDCEDPACGPGAVCGPNGLACAQAQSCSACSGNGGLAESHESTCGDGFDNDCDGAIDCADPDCQGQLCDTVGHTCTPPDAAGRSTCGGAAPVGGTAGTIGYFRLVSAEYQVLGALGSGYHEQSLLTFEILSVDGSPLAGVRVTFSHEAQGGSFIGAVARCTGTFPPVCTADGTTDAAGHVGVLLHSGRRFAALSVRARASAGGVTRDLEAGGFTVVGAKPNGARFSVDCRPYNVPAMTAHDCLYSRYDGPERWVNCTATLGDRHDNAIAVPTLVSFQTEAGLITPATLTPPFDPSKDGKGLGDAIAVLDVYGGPLPFDVAPFASSGEKSNLIDFGCGLRTANPRDGLVTVMALVQGEEGFVDLDLNGQYDAGEPFIDLGEPFLDVNDDGVRDPGDGVRDPGEWFLDLDGDGHYTGPNGIWDADTVLWTQGRILYTGYPAYARNGIGNDLFTRVHRGGSPPDPTPPPPPFLVSVGSTEFYDVFFTDVFLNPMTSFSSFGATAVAENVEAKLTPPAHTADSLATNFRLLYCDRQQQPAVCRDGPADQGCRTTPCYLQADLGSWFYYGNPARLSIHGVRPGPDEVNIWATIDNVSSVLSFSGQCLP
jgi:hypothetical protein